ncbi:hypothetical protein HNQ50_002568 [Silvimonas terrae]|uniref:Fimbrial-type adhesion domain-containing protein n=1 Tax=Silvimonas terrae TaxID=300266 RepID=A0A840RH39_9NEIS|nr:fimbrial protein [Silvimonas terrae]MBB5191838.1 hypothetical protein [Silvimonas terrae]
MRNSLLKLGLALFSALWLNFTWAADCTGLNTSQCRITNQTSQFTPTQALSNALADGTVIGTNTTDFDYTCLVATATDRYLILGLNTETALLSAGLLRTTTAGVAFQPTLLAQVGGTVNRIQFAVIGSRTSGGNECDGGHISYNMGQYIKKGVITTPNGLLSLDFSPSVNFVTARYNSSSAGGVYTLQQYEAPASVPVGATTCVLSDGGTMSVDLGTALSPNFSGVGYGNPPNGYTPRNFLIKVKCDTSLIGSGFAADVTLDGVSDTKSGWATNRSDISVIIQDANGVNILPRTKAGVISVDKDGNTTAGLALRAFPTARNGTAPGANTYTTLITVYTTYQ